MQSRFELRILSLAALMAAGFVAQRSAAQDASSQTIELARGKLIAVAPAEWKVAPPQSRMLEKELSIAAPEGVEAKAGRLTVMAAGGSVSANVSRWIGQFKGTEGGADRSGAKIEKSEVNGMKTTLVDLSGTYMEGMGGRPFGPKTPREGYRMLGAIVETGDVGNYFFKLIGPKGSVDPAAEGFKKMIASLEKKP